MFLGGISPHLLKPIAMRATLADPTQLPALGSICLRVASPKVPTPVSGKEATIRSIQPHEEAR